MSCMTEFKDKFIICGSLYGDLHLLNKQFLYYDKVDYFNFN